MNSIPNQTILNDFIIANKPEQIADLWLRFIRGTQTLYFAYEPRSYSLMDTQFSNDFLELKILGSIDWSHIYEKLTFFMVQTHELNERTSKAKQFEIAKFILNSNPFQDTTFAIFIFYDLNGNKRISFIEKIFHQGKTQFSNYKRYTFFVSPNIPNHTFLQQLDLLNFDNPQNVKNVFSVEPVTKAFYAEIQNWYFSALQKIQFPNNHGISEQELEVLKATHLIRLITRLVFVWFIKQKNLVPDILFDENELEKIIKNFGKSGNYYHAILQNLFFATLNQKPEHRKFANHGEFHENRNQYFVKNLYRYADKFWISETEVLELFANIPFLNGGLFDCLDYEDKQKRYIVIDGFSRNSKYQVHLEDASFFSENLLIDLNKIYGTKNNQYPTRGLINILKSYNFTVEENTPVEEEIALDPELLGKVFENLLASYNPETQTTARKATGSFYTPREIVDYMVEEALVEYLKSNLSKDAHSNTSIHAHSNTSIHACENPSASKETCDTISASKDACDTISASKETCDTISASKDACDTISASKDACDTISASKDACENPSASKETHSNTSTHACENPSASKDACDTLSLDARLRTLLSYNSTSNPFNETETLQLIHAINNCKILDPACGSGAFPMGILHKMVNALQKLDPQNLIWKQIQKDKIIGEQIQKLNQDKIAIHGLSDEQVKQKALQAVEQRLKEIEEIFNQHHHFDDYSRKLFLIENCIYGIDIQTIAVQITKLRFFISLVIDQKVISKDIQENRGIRPLPNLETKFIAANTLIGLEKPIQRNLSTQLIEEKENKLKLVRHQYFTASSREQKLRLQEKDRELRQEIAEVLIKSGWNTDVAIQIADFNPYDQNARVDWFDAEWMFGLVPKSGEEGVFDIVIGNPPYIQLQKDGGKLAKRYENQGFKTFERTGDIYSLFYEKGLQLLKNKGILAYITSNKWMRAGYGKSTRALFCQHNPLKLIDLGSGVFESATVDTNILLIQKTTQKPTHYHLKALDIAKEKNITSFDAFADRWTTLTQLSDDAWTIASDIEQRIKQKIEQKGTPLKNWDIQINYGIKTGYNEAFIIDGKKKDELIAQDPKSAEIIKPILRGRDIKRYKAQFADLWLIYIPWHFPLHKDENIKGASEKAEKEFEKQYPAIYKHLLSHKEKLSARNKAETGIRYEWYALQRWASDYYQEFEKEKIVYSEIVREPQFYFDTRKFYPEATVFFISGNHLRYLIALLNGKFITWCFKKFYAGGGLGDEGYRYKKAFLEQIPIPKLSEEEQLPFVQLVEQILALKEQGKDTTALEAEIDRLVYKLYELTYEEVLVIDPSFRLSKEEYESTK